MSKMLRILALACAVLICQPSAQAVGLGGVTVRSHLNEPLDAVIPVTLSGNETFANTEVGLASIEDFNRVGIDYSAAIGQLRFELEQGENGPIIRVGSRQVIRDPYLTFLVEVDSPSGRVVRQYTLLVDPPPAVTQASRRSNDSDSMAQSAPRESTPGSTPTTRANTRSNETQRRSSGASRSGGNYSRYTVEAGDTLYEIANRMRPSDVDVNTMVAALYRNNPDAFYQDNINSLSRGARLDMPSREAIAGLSASEVNSLIRQHNQAWQQGRRRAADRAPVVEGGARDAAGVGQGNSDTGRSEPRLALVPPSGDEGAGADAEELRRELVRTEEDLASAELEADELRSRVDELESITDQQESVISLRDAELAQLRQQLTQMREEMDQADVDQLVEDRQPATGSSDSQTTMPETRDAEPADTSPEEPVVSEPEPTDSSASEQATATEQAEEEPQVPQRRREMPMTADPEASGMNLMMLLGLGGLVMLLIVAGVVIFLVRRSKSGEQSSGVAGMAEDDEASQNAMTESLLIQSITDDPEDPQARLSLLRFYFEADNRDAFVAAAAEMHQRLDNPEESEHWQAAVAMGEQIAPEDPMFGGDGAAADAGDDFDADDADDGDETVQDEPAFDDPHSFDEGFGDDLDSDDDDFTKAFERTDNLTNLEEQLPEGDGEVDAEPDWTSDEFGGGDSGGEDEFSPTRDTDVVETLSDAEDDDDLDGLDFDLGDTRDASGADLGAEDPAAESGSDSNANEGDDSDLDFGDDLVLDLDDDTMSASADDEGGAFNLDDSISTDVETAGESADDDGDDLSFDLGSELEEDSSAGTEGEATADLSGAAEAASDDDDGEAFDLDFDLGDEDLFAEGDAVTTKLSLAEAYVDEGQTDDARGMLEEVLAEGNEEQKKQAQEMLDKL